jgi:hypothetical protein
MKFARASLQLAAPIALIVMAQSATHAQTIDIPLLSACTPANRPELPARWHAVGLMAPFYGEQLDVGEFVYDSAVPALRASVYGLESGAVDLLITAENTYRLTGPHRAPTGCRSLGKKFSLPAGKWLSEKSVCVGEAPISAAPAQWWKTPLADGRTDWRWYRKSTRMPWRMLLPAPVKDPAVIGDYALTYFPKFEPVAQTDLASLRDLCTARADKTSDPETASAVNARALMAANAERQQRIDELVPGLGHKACSRMTPVKWPNQFAMTAIVTPIKFSAVGPLPSIIFYDWTEAKAQAARMFLPTQKPPVLALYPVLQKGIGYHVQQQASGAIACTPKYPGMVRPDWMSVSQCACRGVIEPGAAFGNSEAMQILSCPMPGKQRVMWNWYSEKGRPLLFVESGAQGDGLMMADYRQWLPGQKIRQSQFQLPPQCVGPGNTVISPPGKDERFSQADGADCSTCHTMPE